MTDAPAKAFLAAGAFLAAFFFAGAEIGIVSCDRIRLRYLSERGSHAARVLLGLLVHPDRLVASTLLGTNIASVTCSALVTSLCFDLWGLEGTRIAVPVFIVAYIVLAEIFPKALFRVHADRFVLWSAYPLAVSAWLLGPGTRLLQALSRALVRLFPGAGRKRTARLTREELAHFLERSGHAGSAGRRWFRAVLGISERTVASVLVPLDDLPAATDSERVGAAAARLREAGGSFLLVRRADGEPRGTVGVHDLLDAPAEHAVGDFARPAPVVRADLRVEALLPEIQSGATPLAFVVSADGAIVGIVTHESIAFAIVGTVEEAPAAALR
jgi:CBS domain containing-hemolysin-like protein